MEYYLIIINIITFILYGIDKFKAKRGMYRISEKNLFILSILGGGIGAFLGMKLFKHKTRKISFWIVNILFIIIWIIILIYL